MQFIFIKIFLISSLLFNGLPKKIFNFPKITNYINEKISTVNLSNIPTKELPDIFVICSTHKQEEFNTKNTRIMYSIYSDEDFDELWFSIGLWANNKLWVNVKNLHWYPFSYLPAHLVLDWFTICIEINTIRQSISASIGGENLHKVENITSLDKPPRLYLKMGVVDLHGYSQDYTKNYPYHGMITEINVFNSTKIEIIDMSKYPCNFMEANVFLKWDSMHWNIAGGDVIESFIDDSEVCTSSEFAYFRIPLKWTKEKGLYVCKVWF